MFLNRPGLNLNCILLAKHCIVETPKLIRTKIHTHTHRKREKERERREENVYYPSIKILGTNPSLPICPWVRETERQTDR